jgi:hypothetical protein
MPGSTGKLFRVLKGHLMRGAVVLIEIHTNGWIGPFPNMNRPYRTGELPINPTRHSVPGYHEPSLQDGRSCIHPTRHCVPGYYEWSRWDMELPQRLIQISHS